MTSIPYEPPGSSPAEIREWAAECYAITRDRMLESLVWQAIAEDGQEWQPRLNQDGTPYHGGALMTPRECFTNSQRTLVGATAFDPTGCSYAEGWALTHLGMWQHHGWLVDANGLVIDRTYARGAQRYVGVICLDETTRQLREGIPEYRLGQCLLTDDVCGMAWAPGMNPEHFDLLFESVRASKE